MSMPGIGAVVSLTYRSAVDDPARFTSSKKVGPWIPQALIRAAVDLELADAIVIADTVADTPCIFLGGLYHAEKGIADRLHKLIGGPPTWPAIDADKALPWIEQKTGLTLAPSQSEAIRLALRSKVMVITGGPGVGKTTIVNSILQILAAKAVTLLLCAPTGRAAKRMKEATGMEAKTIHRLVEIDPKSFGFKRNEENPIDCDLLVIEALLHKSCEGFIL